MVSLSLRSFLAGIFLSGLIFGYSNASENRRVFEKRDSLPFNWVKSHKPDPSLVFPVRIGLKQENIDKLETFLNEISHPESSRYGQHWTPDQIAETFAPTAETIDRVHKWLTSSGIAADRVIKGKNKAWVKFNATVKEMEKLLDCEYMVYRHGSGTEHIASTSYSLPENLHSHIDLITPTLLISHAEFGSSEPTHQALALRDVSMDGLSSDLLRSLGSPTSDDLPKLKGPLLTPIGLKTDLDTCDVNITPDCIRALYNIKHKPIATDKNTFGIVEYTPQAILQTDLNLFFQNFSTTQALKTPNLVSIDGGIPQNISQGFNFNGESSLDLQYGMTLTNPQPVQLYQVGDLVEGASFNNLLDALDASFCTFEGGDDPNEDGIYPDPLPGGFNQPESCGIVTPANVISTSFSMNEADATPAYLTRQCNEYGKLGLLGTTILYSSGDRGVAGRNNICIFPNGTRSTHAPGFLPSFPGTCPFITSVGATQVNPGAKVTDPESACEQVIFSGGGFSNVFAVPDYQKAAQAEFFARHNPPYNSTQYNNSRAVRGYPDVSANGANYVIAVNGRFSLVFGTSASTPVVGSIITLVNDARIAIGKKPVGFINPTIYSPLFKHAFNDIVNGTNPGCSTPGFSAVEGWDPVTGVGTPNLEKLIGLWLALP
ncbi:subtilisin-like protein [Hysterangium stoloniferum]|nr:subtilisin-like protein [Hysterangium stoloniferum]